MEPTSDREPHELEEKSLITVLGTDAGRLCPSCSENNEEGSRHCAHCGYVFPRKKRISPLRTFMFLGAAAILLSGGVWFLSKSNAESTLVGKVNGEGITRKEFNARVERIKKFYESQGLFEGQNGDETLTRIKDEILDEMIMEKVLLQQAKGSGFAVAPENEVARQLDEIKKMSGLTEPELEKRIGVKIEELKLELSDRWAVSQYIEKEVLKDNPQNREIFLQEWLAGAVQKASVEKFEKPKPFSTAKASCCAPGGGCGGGKVAKAPDSDVEKDAREKGLEYYEKKTQKKGAEARVTDFGCHIQVDIVENGKVVLSLTYNQGVIQET